MPGFAFDPTEAFQRAVASYRAGRLAEAERLCLQIIDARPDHFDALHVLAVVQAGQGRHEQALANYERALSLRSGHADALNNRGSTLLALDRLDEALASYEQALAARPDFPEALSNRGSALERLGRLDEALASYERALSLRPDFVDALYNRGNALKALGRHREALASYERVLSLRPRHADALNNRGQVLKELMRFDEALSSYDAALAVEPGHTMAHCNASALLLLTGDLRRGFREYEWRWKKAAVARGLRAFAQPLWLGREPVGGKTILVHAEQGLGDTIQFCRYVPLLVACGARVIFEVQETLCALMSDFAAGAEVVARGRALPAFDLHCPLLSLPLAFGTELATIPSPSAYLRAPPRRTEEWRERLRGTRRPRIGLVWSGNPGHERDRERSIPLHTLLPLLDAEATFVGLQKDVRAADAALLKERGDILPLGAGLGDFADTAALVAVLDLVVSVDTSVAHLAGALGKPVWILLTHVPDWRWLLGRTDSPWYASARLFRQDASCTWDGVVARVRAALLDFAART
jgi:tetratricopeptide (TPR) repeat protein